MTFPLLLATAVSVYMARIYGAYIGFRVYSMGGPAGEYFYGGGTVFMVAWPISILIIDRMLWPAFREASHVFFSGAGRGMLSLTRKAHARPALASGEIKEAVEQGYLLQYHGLVSRKLPYQGGTSKTAWLHCDVMIERNTLVMPRLERFFVHTLLELENHGIPEDARDRLTFALAWGDGRCRVTGGKIKGDPVMLAQYQIRDHRSLVSIEAGFRDITTEGAITELATLLQQAAQQPDAPEQIQDLYQRLIQLRNAR